VSAFDIIDVIQGPTRDFLTEIQKTNVEFLFQKTRCEFRNETMLIHYLLVLYLCVYVINKKCVINLYGKWTTLFYQIYTNRETNGVRAWCR
jgi:hypothetical protein